jgi:hypothetical protein
MTSAQKQSDFLTFPSYKDGNVTFGYDLSKPPYYQWWAIYRGVMPSWDNLKQHSAWDWFTNTDGTAQSGTVTHAIPLTSGCIYTVALFNDQSKSAYDLADFQVFYA